ncbi:MAG: hypothetical protein HYS05_08945 [Acidobacteria bacterium]|nr:hypothetical protein [Acidobacteriota bacterium]
MRIRAVLVSALAAIAAMPLAGQVQKMDVPGIRNYSRVDATVGCGGQVDPAAMAALRTEGFVSVINLRLATEADANVNAGRAAAQAAGLKYIHLPFNAGSPDPKVVESFLAAVSDKTNQPVFIHCGSANRVGGVWMIKRVLQDGWPIDQARVEAEAIGLNNPQLAAFAVEYINTHR